MFRWTHAVLPLTLLAAPAPAYAADHALSGAAAVLNDPAMQDRIADSVTAMIDALMQVNVGQIAQAAGQIDPDSRAAHIPADATLGDLARPGDPDMARRMGDDVRASAYMMGKAATAIAVMSPVLKDMARDLAAQWQLARQDARRR